MRLTAFSDLSFRVLLYAAAHREALFTIDQMSAYYGQSRGHLMKVVNGLTRAGYLTAIRGRSGGLLLAREPEDIRLDEVLRLTETDFCLVECMRPESGCVIAEQCKLPEPFRKAMAAFIEVLSGYTLQDVILSPEAFSALRAPFAPNEGLPH